MSEPKKCNKCERSEPEVAIVYSGIDALLLECMEDLRKICYPCANDQKAKNLLTEDIPQDQAESEE